jgi:hypothetical protein
MSVETQAALEIARFIASHPTPEQVIAFQPSPDVVKRAYELIDAERIGMLSKEEYEEMESYLIIQHIMILAKAEAHRQL